MIIVFSYFLWLVFMCLCLVWGNFCVSCVLRVVLFLFSDMVYRLCVVVVISNWFSGVVVMV